MKNNSIKHKSIGKKVDLPLYFKYLLWEYDLKDNQDLGTMIILRTLEFGELKHIKWVFTHYDLSKIFNVFSTHGIKNLNSKSFNFWFQFFKHENKIKFNWANLHKKRSLHVKLNRFWNY